MHIPRTVGLPLQHAENIVSLAGNVTAGLVVYTHQAVERRQVQVKRGLCLSVVTGGLLLAAIRPG